MDVYIDPDRRPRGTTSALFAHIRDAIAGGRLRAGDRLPTSRWLAADLGVARSTVTTVYERLIAEGFLEARVGDGTFVAAHAGVDVDRAGSQVNAVTIRRPAPTRPARAQVERFHIDLRSGRPDPALFPLRDWRRSVRDASELAPPGYGDPAGLPALRAALASWLGRSRGLSVEPQEVLVTSGAQQAFDLCAQVLVSNEGLVAIEEPGYEPARRAFAYRGARIQHVPVDGDGIKVDEINSSVELAFVTPSHQSPSGVTMTAARRSALIDLAYARDVVIVEDDYDTEYRYVDRPLEPLYRRDSGGRVIYLGSFSKTLSPSLRVGFLVGPRLVVDALAEARSITDLQPPHLVQAAVADFIVTGGFERHLRRTRPIYAGRHRQVVEWLEAMHATGLAAPAVRSNAGLHAMLRLPAGADHHGVAQAAFERGVFVPVGDEYWGGTPEPSLIIGFGLADNAQLAEALGNIHEELEHASHAW